MKKLIDDIVKFRNERGWEHHDTPAALAKSIIIEAAELLENYQWDDVLPDKENVKEEIADVLIYSIAMCSDLGLDPEKIIREKLDKNAKRYPKIKKNER